MKKILTILCIALCTCVFFACSSKNNLNFKEQLCTYNLTLEYNNQKNTVGGNLNFVFYNNQETAFSNLKFHLYSNAFRENSLAQVVSKQNHKAAYPNGESFGHTDIFEVKSKTNNLNFKIEGEDQNILSVDLEDSVFPNTTYSFDIEFETTLANINHRLGYGENAINVFNFYPVLCVYENGEWAQDLYSSNGDPFYSDVANYNCNLTYNNNNQKLASSGFVSKTQIKEDKTYVEISAPCVRDFGFALSTKFKTESVQKNATTLNYFYYNDSQKDQTMQTIQECFAFFENKIGKYPYKQLSVVESNFVHGGMEYPNIVLVSDNLSYSNYIMATVHEICHQWWYGVVGNNEFKEGYIDEGLTEFYTLLFFNSTQNNLQTAVSNATKNYTNFEKVYKSVQNGQFDASMDRALNEYNTEYEYVYMAYTKGVLMFASVYELIGQDKFFDCGKMLYSNYAYCFVDRNNLVSTFCKASGKNLQPIFDSFIDGKVQIV